jgi:hypothetical protein
MRPSIGKYLWGMVASLIILLAGGWLILAPFALGYQRANADWASQTVNDFVIGIAVAVVALIGFILFFYTLLVSLRAAGVLAARTRPVEQATVPSPIPQASAPPSDLDRTLATLAAALASDMAMRRQGSGNQQSDQPVDQMVNRRDV